MYTIQCTPGMMLHSVQNVYYVAHIWTLKKGPIEWNNKVISGGDHHFFIGLYIRMQNKNKIYSKKIDTD